MKIFNLHRFNNKKGAVERLEEDLEYDDRKKPYWTYSATLFDIAELLFSDWEIVE